MCLRIVIKVLSSLLTLCCYLGQNKFLKSVAQSTSAVALATSNNSLNWDNRSLGLKGSILAPTLGKPLGHDKCCLFTE